MDAGAAELSDVRAVHDAPTQVNATFAPVQEVTACTTATAMDCLLRLTWTLLIPLVGCTPAQLRYTLIYWNIIKARGTTYIRLHTHLFHHYAQKAQSGIAFICIAHSGARTPAQAPGCGGKMSQTNT